MHRPTRPLMCYATREARQWGHTDHCQLRAVSSSFSGYVAPQPRRDGSIVAVVIFLCIDRQYGCSPGNESVRARADSKYRETSNTYTLHKFDASLLDCCYSHVIDVILRVTNTLTRIHCIIVATDSLSVSCHDYRYYVYRMRCYLLADVSTYWLM